MMTNKGPYRIIKSLNDVNFVVQKLPTSGMEIVHIDRLTRFHGTVPKPWKQILRKEQETASEMSASEDEASASAANVEATRAKNAAALLEQVIANANNSDAPCAADKNASDCNTAAMDMNVVSTDSDMTVDLIDFTDSSAESIDYRVEGQAGCGAMAGFSACIEDVTELARCVVDQRTYADECCEFVEQTVRRSKTEYTVGLWPGLGTDDCRTGSRRAS